MSWRNLAGLSRDPSTTSTPPPPPSPLHARLEEVLSEAAGHFLVKFNLPGGDRVTNLVLNRLRREIWEQPETELRGQLTMLRPLIHYVLTGEQPSEEPVEIEAEPAATNGRGVNL